MNDTPPTTLTAAEIAGIAAQSSDAADANRQAGQADPQMSGMGADGETAGQTMGGRPVIPAGHYMLCEAFLRLVDKVIKARVFSAANVIFGDESAAAAYQDAVEMPDDEREMMAEGGALALSELGVPAIQGAYARGALGLTSHGLRVAAVLSELRAMARKNAATEPPAEPKP